MIYISFNIEKLKNPPIKLRPANYWGWLGDISPTEAAWQVEQMYTAGLGGYVPHSRGGREVPYMGKDWMDSVESILNTGDKYGMMTIMDDEDGWPSGFGGGYVNKKGVPYHVKWLVCNKIESFNEEEKSAVNFLGFYKIGEQKIKITYGSSEYYVDNMDEKVVDAFIEAGYESYYKRFGDRFYGIFSDEPQLAREHIPWSDIIPEKFLQRYGYDIKENLDAVFFDVKGYEKIRFDYWKLVSELFEISYGKKIGDWCRAHNIIFTGHTTLEESLPWQMKCSGSTMQFYEHFDIPGMDWLCRVPVSNMAVKQLTTVSEQTNKERVLSEMYGCCGWNIGFDDMKWIGEWHFVHGVNFMLQHLGLYSLKGSRKREYPASLFYQQPWWSDYPVFNDYFARLSLVIKEGKPMIDILLLHPMSSIWTLFNDSNNDLQNSIEGSFKNLSTRLMDQNYNYHYGDDAIMKRHLKIEDNKAVIGNYKYKIIIMPEMTNINDNTFTILINFANNGGIILSLGRFPHLVNGELNPKIEELKKYVKNFADTEVLLIELEKYNLRPLIIKSNTGDYTKNIYSRSMLYENEMCHYIVNTNNISDFNINIKTISDKNLKKFNLNTCEFENINYQNYNLRPTESLLLFETNDELCLKENIVYTNEMNLNGNWEIKKCTENALVLDMCEYSFDGKNFEDEIYILKLQKKLLNEKTNRDVYMNFNFYCDIIPSECWLLIEEPEKNEIKINGLDINASVIGWHYDKNFKKIPIEKYLVKGKNIITIKRYFYLSERVYEVKNNPSIHEAESNRMTFETELEAIYLIGDFIITQENGEVKEANISSHFMRGKDIISKPKNHVNINDLTTDGFKYFAGKIYLEKEIDWYGGNCDIIFNHPDAIVLKLFINGEYVKTLCWEPFKAEIGKFLKQGKNIIGIELTNSMRNLLGPHHHKGGELIGFGPNDFGTNEHSWNAEYNIVRFGAGNDLNILY